MKTFCKTVAWLLLVLFVVGIISFVWVRTDGGNEDFKAFELKHGKETIVQATSEATFSAGVTERYDVGYFLDTSKEPRDYSVKIEANTAEDFTYAVGDASYAWRNVKTDLSEYFGLKKEADHFTFTVPEGYTLEKAIGSLYDGAEVSAVTAEEGALPFLLVVSSYNEKVTYFIRFGVAEAEEPPTDPEDPEDPDEPVVHTISWKIVGGTLQNFQTFTCPETAQFGEKVTFQLQTSAEYAIDLNGVVLRYANGAEAVVPPTGDPYLYAYPYAYSFIMPDEDVTLVVTIRDVTQPDEELEADTYKISYAIVDMDGMPFVWTVQFQCQETAKAGDTVTLSITPNTGCQFFSAVLRSVGSEDLPVEEVGNVYSRKYSFTMPAADVLVIVKLRNLLSE